MILFIKFYLCLRVLRSMYLFLASFSASTSKAAVIEVNKQRLDKDLGNTLNHVTLKIREGL